MISAICYSLTLKLTVLKLLLFLNVKKNDKKNPDKQFKSLIEMIDKENYDVNLTSIVKVPLFICS